MNHVFVSSKYRQTDVQELASLDRHCLGSPHIFVSNHIKDEAK